MSGDPADPRDALTALAAALGSGPGVIAPHVVEPGARPVLGPLAAAGPRAERRPGTYSLVVESVYEGYLLHYEESRVLSGHDEDLALLAGDYLYALGIERLAGLGDADAVRQLGDLISLVAQARAEERPDLAPALWLAAAVAVGCGADDRLEGAKELARRLEPDAAGELLSAARARASEFGLAEALDGAAESIDLRARSG
jgi:hypothetical protein